MQAVRVTSPPPSFCEYIYGAMKGSWFGKEVIVCYQHVRTIQTELEVLFSLKKYKISGALIP